MPRSDERLHSASGTAPQPAEPFGEAATRKAIWKRTKRHSWLVRTLRLALPLTGAVLAAGLFVSYRALPSAVGEVDPGSIGVDGDTVTMASPKLTGYAEGGMSYAVSAESAQQKLTQPNVVHLKAIDGRLDEGDGNWTKLRAEEGLLDTEMETLRLDRRIELTTKDGKRAQLQSADVDFAKKTVSTDQPVAMQMDVGSVEAKSMTVSEGGNRILLRGNVVVDLHMNGARAGETATSD